MIFKLPTQDFTKFNNMDKIRSYNLLYNANCNVLRSVLLTEKPTRENINEIKKYLHSNSFMLRYQYIKSTPYHKCGGNKHLIDPLNINNLWDNNAYIWMMEPIDRRKNLYGINIMVNKQINKVIFEIVGKGFDVSDINRGRIIPHEIVETDFPLEKGYYLEIWKYMKVTIANQHMYTESILCRKEILDKLEVKYDKDIFPKEFRPLPLCYLYKLYEDIENIDVKVKKDNYCVSCSVDEKGVLVYWDVQIPEEKLLYY